MMTGALAVILALVVHQGADVPAATNVAVLPEARGPSTAAWVGTVSLASGFAVVTSGLGAVAALGVPSWCLAKYGQPRPWCTALGVTLAAAAQVLLGWLVVPELFRLVGADPTSVRAGLWSWARWPAAAMALSTVLIIAGSWAEQRQYGAGQGAMFAGLLGVSVGGVTFDVLEVIGATRAALASAHEARAR